MITPALQSIIEREVSRQLRASRINDGAGALRVDPYNIPFQNKSGEVIPPFAVMRPETFSFRSGNWFIEMVQVDDNFRRRYYINGPFAIPDNGFGNCSDGSYPTPVKFSGLGTFTDFLTNFGVESGSWELKKGGVGRFHFMEYSPYSQGYEYPTSVAYFQQSDCESLIVQSRSVVTPGDYTTFNICDIGGETTIQLSALCQIYPSAIGGDGGDNSTAVTDGTWPDDTIFGAHFYGIRSANHANDWRIAWGYSPGSPP